MSRTYGIPTSRLIYPETVRSEQIRELAKNKDHLLLWHSLFFGVDDQGRMEARVSTIQTLCLGHLPENAIRPRTIQEALIRMQSLEDEDGIPIIYIYSANGTKVLQFAKWWAFQNGMRNSWPSRWDPMPGWVDEIRGHGRKALSQIIAKTSGPDGDPTGGVPMLLNHNQNNLPNGKGDKPFGLFSAFLEERGLTKEDYPGYRIQLGHAKKMLADGFTIAEVREATKAFAADPYWSTVGFDLSKIHAHWGKMKAQRKAKPASRPFKPVQDGPLDG